MSEINLEPKKENVDLINRKPLAYMVGVLLLLLSVFVSRSFLIDNNRSSDCQEQVKDERKRADDATNTLVRYLLKEKERKASRDSVLRSTIKK